MKKDFELTEAPYGINTFMGLPLLSPNQAEEADIGVFGVKFDLGTYFKKGSREAPSSIRDASMVLRPTNFHTGVTPVNLCKIADIGDAPLNPMKFDESIDLITEFVTGLKKKGVVPLAIGGDHTIPLPIMRGLYDGEPFGVVQFDAHSDTDDVLYDSELHYSSPFRRAIEQGVVDPKRCVQIGLRSQIYTPESFDWARDMGVTMISMDDFDDMGRKGVIEKTRSVIGDLPAYLTVDIDVLDAAQCPGTGVPEPGGLTTRDLLVVLRGLRELNWIGADLCEVNPSLDSANITSITAANIIFDMVCLLAESYSLKK